MIDSLSNIQRKIFAGEIIVIFSYNFFINFRIGMVNFGKLDENDEWTKNMFDSF